MRCGLCGCSGEQLVGLTAELPFGRMAADVCLACLGELSVWRGSRRLLGALRHDKPAEAVG